MSNKNESHARSRKLGTYPGSNDIELTSINPNIQTNDLPQQNEDTESRSVPDTQRTLQPQQKEGLTLSELHYSLHSFNAVAIPVSITMILSALSVIYVTTPMVKAQTETSLNSFYVVFDVGGEDSSVGENLGLSLVNSFIIVSVIAAMTFLIGELRVSTIPRFFFFHELMKHFIFLAFSQVILYKFRSVHVIGFSIPFAFMLIKLITCVGYIPGV
jgi:hypothetical protein